MKVFIHSSCEDIKYCEILKSKLERKDETDLLEGEYLLKYTEDRLQLISKDKKPILCNFLDQAYLREVQQGYGRTESIFKFLKTKEKLKILDLTVGFGRDFFKGVLCGHDMIGLERDPLVFALLQDGIKRFNESNESQILKEKFKVDEFKIKILNNEAASFLKDIEDENEYDIIFFDPMFDSSAKSGKAKKSIQLLREFISSNEKEEIMNIIKLGRMKTNQFILKAEAAFKANENEILSIHKGKGFKFISFKK